MNFIYFFFFKKYIYNIGNKQIIFTNNFSIHLFIYMNINLLYLLNTPLISNKNIKKYNQIGQ